MKKLISAILTVTFILTQCGIGIAAPMYNKVGQNLRADIIEGEGNAIGDIGAELQGNRGYVTASTIGGGLTDGFAFLRRNAKAKKGAVEQISGAINGQSLEVSLEGLVDKIFDTLPLNGTTGDICDFSAAEVRLKGRGILVPFVSEISVTGVGSGREEVIGLVVWETQGARRLSYYNGEDETFEAIIPARAAGETTDAGAIGWRVWPGITSSIRGIRDYVLSLKQTRQLFSIRLSKPVYPGIGTTPYPVVKPSNPLPPKPSRPTFFDDLIYKYGFAVDKAAKKPSLYRGSKTGAWTAEVNVKSNTVVIKNSSYSDGINPPFILREDAIRFRTFEFDQYCKSLGYKDEDLEWVVQNYSDGKEPRKIYRVFRNQSIGGIALSTDGKVFRLGENAPVTLEEYSGKRLALWQNTGWDVTVDTGGNFCLRAPGVKEEKWSPFEVKYIGRDSNGGLLVSFIDGTEKRFAAQLRDNPRVATSYFGKPVFVYADAVGAQAAVTARAVGVRQDPKFEETKDGFLRIRIGLRDWLLGPRGDVYIAETLELAEPDDVPQNILSYEDARRFLNDALVKEAKQVLGAPRISFVADVVRMLRDEYGILTNEVDLKELWAHLDKIRQYADAVGAAAVGLGDVRVLVVDDEFGPRESIYWSLATKGVPKNNITKVPDVAAAIDFISKNPVDVVITDWKMPGQNGDVLIEHIAANFGDRLPVILLAAVADQRDVSELAPEQQAIVKGIVGKPFNRNDLYASIEKAVPSLAAAVGDDVSNMTLAEVRKEFSTTNLALEQVQSQLDRIVAEEKPAEEVSFLELQRAQLIARVNVLQAELNTWQGKDAVSVLSAVREEVRNLDTSVPGFPLPATISILLVTDMRGEPVKDIIKTIELAAGELKLAHVNIVPFDVNSVEGGATQVINSINEEARKIGASRIIIRIDNDTMGIAASFSQLSGSMGVIVVDVSGLDAKAAGEAIKTSL